MIGNILSVIFMIIFSITSLTVCSAWCFGVIQDIKENGWFNKKNTNPV